MAMKYSNEQHREYIGLSRKIGVEWINIFDGNNEFYSTDYWDLLTEMWYADRPLMVSDALRFMKSIKSPFTARKYLQKVIDEGMVVEMKNPKDERSMLVLLAPAIKKKLDTFFDHTITQMVETVADIKAKK